MGTTTLKITGMTCRHCAMAVTKALTGVDGVVSAEVSLEQGSAVVVGSAAAERLIQAIEQKGYHAQRSA